MLVTCNLRPSTVQLHPFPSHNNDNSRLNSGKPNFLKCSTNTSFVTLRNATGSGEAGMLTPARRKKRVAVYWDLDNKPPNRVHPYDAATAVRKMGEAFGELVDLAAFANRHAFLHVPDWVRQTRRARREMDIMESKGIAVPDNPYVCEVCGRKCSTNVDLRKHFKQLHERERNKRMSRLNSLKGKRKSKFMSRIQDKEDKYKGAAENLIYPKSGYGLMHQLRKAGVFVKTVKDKPQAADAALKTQIRHCMTRGVQVLCLISDDSDFLDVLAKARTTMRTVVLGDNRALQRQADLWLPWDRVISGSSWEHIHAAARGWSLEDGIVRSLSDLQEEADDVSEQDDEELDFVAINRVSDRISDEVVAEIATSRNSAFSDNYVDDILQYQEDEDEDYYFP